jgi:hypothetical protein
VREAEKLERLRLAQATRCPIPSGVPLGIVVFVAQWIGGDPGSGLVSLAIMTAFGALLLLGGRSETIRGLRGADATSASARSTSTRPRSPAWR